jgi:hypothetical protein
MMAYHPFRGRNIAGSRNGIARSKRVTDERYPDCARHMVTRSGNQRASAAQKKEVAAFTKRLTVIAAYDRQLQIVKKYAKKHKMPMDKCMACSKPAPARTKTNRIKRGTSKQDKMNVDHVAGAKVPRGCICGACNSALSNLTIPELEAMLEFAVANNHLRPGKTLRSGRKV